MPELTYMCSFKLLPMTVAALLQLDLSIAFPLIDLLLGGEGRGTAAYSSTRDFSPKTNCLGTYKYARLATQLLSNETK